MTDANTSCKNCAKRFHFCASCGTDGHSEDGYCSWECATLIKTKKAKQVAEDYGLRLSELEELLRVCYTYGINSWDISE